LLVVLAELILLFAYFGLAVAAAREQPE
jgi:hypothetical protein